MNVDEEYVIVGATGDDAESMTGDGTGERFRVSGDLLLIFAEGRLHGFFQANRFGGESVNERAAVRAGESELGDFRKKGGLAKNRTATRTTQGFVGGGENDI